MEEAKLIVIRNEKDKDGIPIQKEEEIDVFCRELSVRQSEFYAAKKAGFEPRIILELRCEDWELSEHMEGDKKEYASKVRYDGSLYDVIRTYKISKSMIQVTLG